MKKILCYTRKPIDEFYYDPRLAYSMHLAVWEQGTFVPLNHNSGLLFAKADEKEDGSLNPKSIRNPYLFTLKDGRYGILAVRTDGDGGEDADSAGAVMFFRSADLLEYEEIGFITLTDQSVARVACEYCVESGRYKIYWCANENEWYAASCEELETDGAMLVSEQAEPFEVPYIETDIEGVVPGNVIEIEDVVASRLQQKLMPARHVETKLAGEAVVNSREELERITATAVYSDGTEAVKRIDWEADAVDWSRPGSYEVTGRLHQDHFSFPIAEDRADPCVARWNGKYYFIATNDADQNHTLYIREADTIPKLVNAPEHLILDSDTYDHVGNLLWAPEFHEIEGRLYLFLALTPEEFFCEESHIMELCEGGDPTCREDWSEPKRVVRKDGSELCEAGKTITLDMTCFFWEGDYYAVWSQRQFLPKDLGAWLYIAKLNPQEPWKLSSDPVLLSKPEYGWANNHTFVDEGPFALSQENRLILTFSSAAVDTSYVVGILTIEKGKDLLARDNWKKGNYPILTSRSVEGEFGTGHNAYVVDEYGDIWNTYHARPGIHGERSSGIRRVHFDVDGLPVLDLVEERDVAQELSAVKMSVVVGEKETE